MRRNFPQTNKIILKDDSLSHFGVKGMRWGVVKKEESEGVRTAKAKLEEIKSWNGKPDKISLADRSEHFAKVVYAKRDLDNAKILDKVNSRPKSKYHLKMEEGYKKLGMNDEEAAVAAYRNIQTKKTLAFIAGATLLIGAAYVGHKEYDRRVDKIIKAGGLIKNVSTDNTKSIRDAFYGSINSKDHTKYVGFYGDTLKRQGGSVFQKEIRALSDIRQASPKHAEDTFKELMQNRDIRKQFFDHLSASKSMLDDSYDTQGALRAIERGTPDRNAYEVFNAFLVDHRPGMQTVTEQYFKRLGDKGYNAIRDVNDMKYSGFDAKSPLILFGTSGKVEVTNVLELSKDRIFNNYMEANKQLKIDEDERAAWRAIRKATFGGLGVAGGYNTLKLVNRRAINYQVAAYRRKHPETTMTYTEIERMLERERYS